MIPAERHDYGSSYLVYPARAQNTNPSFQPPHPSEEAPPTPAEPQSPGLCQRFTSVVGQSIHLG